MGYERNRRGRNGRKVPASAARTTTVRIGGGKPHDGGIRRAHKTSFVHSSPLPVTSRYLTSRRWTRADPPRIGGVKRNVRTPSDPGQPAGAPSTETDVTSKARFMPKRPDRAGSGDTTPCCSSPAQPPFRAAHPGTRPPK